MSFLSVTLPVSLILGAVLVALVLQSVRRGEFDDWEGPAYRHLFDDDSTPEREALLDAEELDVEEGGSGRGESL